MQMPQIGIKISIHSLQQACAEIYLHPKRCELNANHRNQNTSIGELDLEFLDEGPKPNTPPKPKLVKRNNVVNEYDKAFKRKYKKQAKCNKAPCRPNIALSATKLARSPSPFTLRSRKVKKKKKKKPNKKRCRRNAWVHHPGKN
eukprot:150349_1